MRALAAGIAVLLLAAACRDDGRELAEPDRPATTPPVETETTAGPPVEQMDLASPAFPDGGQLPLTYTCEGQDVSPPLEWSGIPPGAAEVALVVDDPDADGFVHWVVTGLPPVDGSLAAGEQPPSEASNDFGALGWGGPCPPPGEDHRYVFTLYALPEPLQLDPQSQPSEAVEAISRAAFDSATLTGSFARPAR